ncbi:hypothetical protein HDU67_004633 [Dinochytrium kinnereticum]|nr:hypothetical protein HDU67_004633 [Dinochytrium kinnereticum]
MATVQHQQRPQLLSTTFAELNLEKKPVVSVSPTATIEDALAIMTKHNVLTLPITSRVWPDKYVYILSSFDILQFFVSRHHGKLGGLDLQSTVEEAMTLDSEQESYRVYERDFRDTIEATCISFAKGIHRVLVTDALKQKAPILVTQTDILRYMMANPEVYANSSISFNSTLASLGFTSRGQVFTATEGETAIEGYARMAANKVAALPVVSKDGIVVDTLSASDLRGMSAGTLENVKLPVSGFVKLSPTHKESTISVSSTDTLYDAFKKIVENDIHRVWILDATGKPVGVVSQSDIIGAAVGLAADKIRESSVMSSTISREPTSSIDWPNLGFAYVKTRSHIKYTWRNGKWDEGYLINNSTISMDVAATAINYGQNCFEGLKAFRMKDGKIRIFRPHLNAKRMRLSCSSASMPEPPEHIFLEAIKRVVQDNMDFVPPQTSNGSLYIRPLVLGTGPQIGLSPAEEMVLLVYVNPVGDYYKGGMGSPVKALISGDFDRAAPRGTGHVKLGGNYAPVFEATAAAKKKGFTVNLFLDAKSGKYVEEFATSNFAGLVKEGDGKWVYVTPRSKSILAGITNRSLAELASRKFGWKVERRQIEWDEVKQGKFEEVAACGTAVVITPIAEIHREVPKVLSEGSQITKKDSPQPYDWDMDEEPEDLSTPEVEVVDVGKETTFEGFRILYTAYRALQTGNLEGWEEFQWMWPAEGI